MPGQGDAAASGAAVVDDTGTGRGEFAVAAGEQRVQAGQQGAGRHAHGQQCVYRGSVPAHGRGGDSVAHDVANAQSDPAAGEGDRVVPVASGQVVVLSWVVAVGELEPVGRWQACGQQVALEGEGGEPFAPVSQRVVDGSGRAGRDLARQEDGVTAEGACLPQESDSSEQPSDGGQRYREAVPRCDVRPVSPLRLEGDGLGRVEARGDRRERRAWQRQCVLGPGPRLLRAKGQTMYEAVRWRVGGFTGRTAFGVGGISDRLHRSRQQIYRDGVGDFAAMASTPVPPDSGTATGCQLTLRQVPSRRRSQSVRTEPALRSTARTNPFPRNPVASPSRAASRPMISASR